MNGWFYLSILTGCVTLIVLNWHSDAREKWYDDLHDATLSTHQIVKSMDYGLREAKVIKDR